MHADTDVVFSQFLQAGIYRFDIVCRRMAGEIAESREIMEQINECFSIEQARELARTFLQIRGLL